CPRRAVTFSCPVSIIFANCFWMSSTAASRFSASARCERSAASASFDALRFPDAAVSCASMSFLSLIALSSELRQSPFLVVASAASACDLPSLLRQLFASSLAVVARCRNCHVYQPPAAAAAVITTANNQRRHGNRRY